MAKRYNPPILCIVGRSDSGKTALIERLVPELKRRGYRVGTVKHNAQSFEIDLPGKDSYRHFHAGAEATLVASSERVALVKRLDAPMELDSLVAQFMRDVDLVIAEGYKSCSAPKIEVFRAAVHPEPLCQVAKNYIAVVTDDLVELPVPTFRPAAIKEVAEFIIARLLKGGPRGKKTC